MIYLLYISIGSDSMEELKENITTRGAWEGNGKYTKTEGLRKASVKNERKRLLRSASPTFLAIQSIQSTPF